MYKENILKLQTFVIEDIP